MSAILNLPDIRPSLLLDFANSGRVDPRIRCTRASAATCYGPDGKLRTVAANVPRIDYDPATGKCLGLLVEEQRTNLWLNSATATAAQSFTVTAQTYVLSFEGSGSLALTGVHIGSSSTAVLIGGRKHLVFTPSAGALTCTPAGDVKNVQLEAGLFGTSYIPTGGSAVTRAAELVQMDLRDWFNPSDGTLFVEGAFAALVSSRQMACLTNGLSGSSLNLMSIQTNPSTANILRANVLSSGVTQAAIGASSQVLSEGVFAKIALAYANNDFAACKDGGGAILDTEGTVPQVSQLNLGWLEGGVSNMHLKRVAYYPKRLPNEQLQRITAL